MATIVRKAMLPSRDDLPHLAAHCIAAAAITLQEPRPKGFPLLFDAQCRLIEPAALFLHQHYIQGVGSVETLRTYSELLYDWFDALDQNEIRWEEATTLDLVAYRNRMRFQ